MIFLTVGTQLPFERLVEAVDDWAGDHPDIEVIAQVGRTLYRPRCFEVVPSLGPEQYYETFEKADVVVSHAGMGTIISALETNKPLLLMPRLAALNEHRNDHQLGTAAHFEKYDLITVVNDAVELRDRLDGVLKDLPNMPSQSPEIQVSPELIARLKSFASQG